MSGEYEWGLAGSIHSSTILVLKALLDEALTIVHGMMKALLDEALTVVHGMMKALLDEADSQKRKAATAMNERHTLYE